MWLYQRRYWFSYSTWHNFDEGLNIFETSLSSFCQSILSCLGHALVIRGERKYRISKRKIKSWWILTFTFIYCYDTSYVRKSHLKYDIFTLRNNPKPELFIEIFCICIWTSFWRSCYFCRINNSDCCNLYG